MEKLHFGGCHKCRRFKYGKPVLDFMDNIFNFTCDQCMKEMNITKYEE